MDVVGDLINLYYRVDGDYDTFKGFTRELGGYDIDGIGDEVSSQAEAFEVINSVTLEEILGDDELLSKAKIKIKEEVKKWMGWDSDYNG